MVSQCSLTVRTYECDSNNHVNNANYLNYLEFARYELLKDVGFDYQKAIRSGYGIYIVVLIAAFIAVAVLKTRKDYVRS